MKQFFSKTMVLVTIIFMDLLTGMEFDLFVPSFPALQNHFHLSASWVAALLSMNFLGYCTSLFFLGDLSDRYGRKPIIIWGVVIFIAGSVLCVWPPSYAFLLFGRLLQGIGIAAPAILSFLIIADSYPIKEQQFLMGVMNGAINIAVAVAPVIGSYVALYFRWQGNFVVLLIMGILVLAMTMLFIPRKQLMHSHESVLLPGIEGYFVIFRSKPLLLLMTTLLFIFVPYWIFVGMTPLLYIKDFGISLTNFGYYQGILALIFAMGSIMFGFMLKNFDFSQKKMLWIAQAIFVVSLIAISAVTLVNTKSPTLITFVILIFIIGQIIPTTILYPICLNFIPHAKGRVSAIIQGARLILTSLGLQVAGYFYVGSFQNIGIIIITFIFVAVFALWRVLNNRELINTLQ